MFLTATSFISSYSLKPLRINFYIMSWFLQTIIFSRIDVIPHHLLASVFVVLLFISSHFLFEAFKNETSLKLPFLGIILSFLVIELVTPIKLAYLFPAFGFSLMLYLFQSDSITKRIIIKTFSYGIYVAVAIILFGFIFKIDFENYYTSEMFSWEISQNFIPNFFSFIHGVGPLFVPCLPALVLFIFKLIKSPCSVNPMMFFGIFSTIFSFIFFFSKLAFVFKGHNSRFLFPEGFIFMAILFIWTFEELSKKMNTKKKKSLLSIIIFSFLICFVFYSKQFLGPRIGFNKDITTGYANDYFNYLDNNIVKGLEFINDQDDRKNILTNPISSLGIIVPSFSNGNVYVGRPQLTKKYNLKANESILFYSRKMDLASKKNFLFKNNIDYIVWTKLDVSQNNQKEFQNPSFILPGLPVKLVFFNDSIKIYKVVR